MITFEIVKEPFFDLNSFDPHGDSLEGVSVQLQPLVEPQFRHL